MYDVVTIGETMLRFTPTNGQRWEQAERWQIHVGGSESNTAVGLARLGHQVAWISRLTDNQFGRKIANSIAYHGVDTGHVVWTNQDRIGTYFYEESGPPRGDQVLYDRAGSSFCRFTASELPQDIFQQGQSKLLHVTGISLGLGPTCIGLITEAVNRARASGWKISFDVNYRAKLWTADEARKVCSPILELADIVFLPIRDAKLLWSARYEQMDLEAQPAAVARTVAEYTRKSVSSECCLVMTLGSLGSCCLDQQSFSFAATQAVPAVGRLGGGDAFAAGFLSGLLRGESSGRALFWGNAAARLKYSIPGDIPFFTESEVARIVAVQAESTQHCRQVDDTNQIDQRPFR